ncbi:hypothetical protein L1987_55558 [Smallanthus sonchifolius]|uniref:Uncharacterized protein n=1 Tax=Smallanthus sonchifolius TaxID=185202 RepID=A0ACB9EAB2_9ASTR|nr:hypothetical protein L1987_55558 [Smallanthus sonchifolius]
MGVCNWFKRRNGGKRKKENLPLKFKHIQQDSIDSKGAKVTDPPVNKSNFLASKREFAATRIQTAFRAYKARKMLRNLKGGLRFQALISSDALTKQTSTSLERLHFWSKIQAEISGRRLCKVAEGRMKQVKLQDRVKVASKLHELETKWWSGPAIKKENGLMMQQVEKATNKNERALAYAFSHQIEVVTVVVMVFLKWRANSSRCFGQAYYDLSKESWGWNWIEPWIVVYRLEGHVVIRPVVSPRARIQEKRRVGVLSNKIKRVDFRSCYHLKNPSSV